jgi:hypothetical protein
MQTNVVRSTSSLFSTDMLWIEVKIETNGFERFWVTMRELYPIKSPSRVKEFGTFAMLQNETISNLVQRMQTLKFALAVQEQTAVFKLIQAIRPVSLSEKVRRQLYATGTESEDWTVALVGQVRLDRAHNQEALWSVSVQHMDAPRAMARMSAPRQPPADHGARTTESRSCHNCGKAGHIARFCRSQPTPARALVMRGHTAKAESTARTDTSGNSLHKTNTIYRPCRNPKQDA